MAQTTTTTTHTHTKERKTKETRVNANLEAQQELHVGRQRQRMRVGPARRARGHCRLGRRRGRRFGPGAAAASLASRDRTAGDSSAGGRTRDLSQEVIPKLVDDRGGLDLKQRPQRESIVVIGVERGSSKLKYPPSWPITATCLYLDVGEGSHVLVLGEDRRGHGVPLDRLRVPFN